ncbi:MAG: hypothetical protein IIZ38_18260 [Sphingomonas sp.]|uniref:YunG family protein n=1 Tax=unclassified Sphingomonas TaxID=196159 RepID=UPI0024548790|nr:MULTISPECIES: hypothetical protein [unclassified Sphingomonas]MBQ1500256.1 hypothetical protein [Sphingomonas sp.]MDH4744121.1 hypothetical protein [Sphingomonas sp. CBMAI 2297]
MSDFAALQSALERAWSIETSSKWLSDNPARGQCSVTALVVQGMLGGEIVKTEVDGAWHFYNLIDGERYDFSASQFPQAVFYADLPSDRDEAFSDTSYEQYLILRDRLSRGS